jgi:hypothetical protein
MGCLCCSIVKKVGNQHVQVVVVSWSLTVNQFTPAATSVMGSLDVSAIKKDDYLVDLRRSALYDTRLHIDDLNTMLQLPRTRSAQLVKKD